MAPVFCILTLTAELGISIGQLWFPEIPEHAFFKCHLWVIYQSGCIWSLLRVAADSLADVRAEHAGISALLI